MLEPIYRIEFFLDAIVNNTTPPEPIYRAEFYLAKIAGSDVEIPEPVYRMEKYLAYLCGEEVELPDPIYRIEYYLAFLCGLNVELPEPIYRVEFWLWDWCGGGGIEKTVTGNPIHILDALAKPAQALSVKLEPIQDLHGYDSPWPAGGGKNIVDYLSCIGVGARNGTESVYSQDTTVTGDVLSISDAYGQNGGILKGIGVPIIAVDTSFTLSLEVKCTGSAITLGYGIYAGGGTSQVDTLVVTPNTWLTVSRTFTAQGGGVGLFVQPTTVGTVLEVRNLQLEIGSSATSYAPYSNICPISGHTDADVTRTGKNLFRLVEAEAIKGGYDYYIPNPIPEAGSYKLTCQNTFGGSSLLGCAVVFRDSVGGANIGAYYAGYGFGDADREGVTTTITAEQANAQYIAFLARSSGLTFSGLSDAQIQIELGSTATAYEEYRGTTYPIPLGTTVYGGTLDVLTGVLTVNWVGVDLGTLSYTIQSNASLAFYRFVAYLPYKSKREPYWAKGICSCYPVTNNVGQNANDNVCGAVDQYIYIADTDYTDKDVFKAAMSGQTFVYELAEPITVQLTPTQVELLLGENNLFSDGEMTLVYLADGNASDEEALNILLGGRYVNNHGEDEPTDREALDILLGR